MLENQPGSLPEPVPQRKQGMHWPSLLQLLFSLLGAITLFSLAALLAFTGLGRVLSQARAGYDNTSAVLWVAGLALVSGLLLPSGGLALLRILGHTWRIEAAFSRPGWFLLATALLIVLLPGVLVLGGLILNQTTLGWLLLPPLHLLAMTIPIFWLLINGLRGLPLGSAQRTWGVFGVGLALAPGIILVGELVLMVFFFFVGVTIIASQPGMAEEILGLAQRLQNSSPSPEAILVLLQPYLSHPAVLGLGSIFMIVAVPLVEESLKPLGVWLLVGRRLSQVEGFVAGLLSGAGYALFENLFLGSTSGAQWSAITLARAGTGTVHMFTTAMVGWGLASAWSERRYLRLGFCFAGAILVHGAWNAFTLLMVAGAVPQSYFNLPAKLVTFASFAPVGLGLLILISFGMLWIFNRRLKHAIIPALPSDGTGEQLTS